MVSDIFVDGVLVGTVPNGPVFVNKFIETRRAGKISNQVNIKYCTEEDKIEIAMSKDRHRRPLIVVKAGKSLFTEAHVKQLKENKIKWSDLIKQGVIESLDALEEDNTLIAINEEDLTSEHTHLEINPIAIFGANSSLVPYSNFNQSSRINRGQKTQRQGASFYATNFLNRLDTNMNLLHYPQRPLVKSFTQDIFGDLMAGGQNITIAVVNYDGYNVEDAIVMNKASLDRGYARSTHYRPYITEKRRYAGGQVDRICMPDKEIQGYTIEEDYRFLEDDGITYPEVEVSSGNVIIGKTSPPRFLSKLESFSAVANTRKDTSIRVKFGEKGVVSKILLTESEDGNPLIRLEVRETRVPVIGDKFASRHGQKGIMGLVAKSEDIPFTSSGIQPDILFSPFGVSKRMTVSQLIEILGGKVAALAGRYINGTAFQSETSEDLRKELQELGFKEDGTETLYDGRTGKEYKARIYIGSIFYLRLKYQAIDKLQARARGRVALLTRQPTAGKAVEGGLRFGEMEKETLVGHGASLLMKERFDSDRAVVHICNRCGNMATFDYYKNKLMCLTCGDKVKASPVEMSYAFKLFLDELKSLGIRPKLTLKDKYDNSN
jgi:DNA-directed RNA polymerase beta subunit